MKRGLSRHNNRSPSGSLPSLNLNFIASAILDPRITFSRGTNATLTGSNGLIQYAPHNLLTNSEDFEAAAWAKGAGVTVAANATIAPDLTTTADNVAFATGGAADFLRTSPAMTVGVVYTVSVYALRVSGTPTFSFDIGNGGGGASTAQTPTTTWQRFSFTFTFAGANSWIDLEASGPGTIAFWGAQLNIGTTAQSYNPTTPKNLLGFTQEPENAAWTKSNSYVQQNLLTWSQDFDNAAWNKGQTSVTANTTVAPDGTITADALVEAATNAQHQTFQSQTLTAATYTFSVYAKSTGGAQRWLSLYPQGTGVAAAAIFNINTGTVTTTLGAQYLSSSVVNVGNGWFRCSITFTGAAVSVANVVYLSNTSVDTAPIYLGDGTSGAFIWGAQLVQGSTAGDYMQTTSAAAPTRYLNWDGTLTGRKLVEDTAAATTHRVFNGTGVTVPTNGAAANIVYAKAGERTAVRLTDNDIQGADFDLLTGAVSNIGSGVTAAATNVGGGWWRLSVIRTNSTGTGRVVLYLISGGTITYTGDGTSGIYVSDFQLSNSASVDPYVYNPQAAAASAAYYGPRFDYNPTTLAANGLLIEEARTNLLTYSEQFDNAAWTPVSVNVTANSTTDPSGASAADTIAANASGAGSRVQQDATVSTTSQYVYSCYLKAGTANTAVLRIFNNTTVTNLAEVTFNLLTGVVSSTAAGSGGITPAGNNWYRCVVTHSGTATATNSLRCYVYPNNTNPNSGDSVFAWGAQLEAGSFATSYVPTQASQVTRNADSASMLGDNFYTWYNPNQGTVYAEGTSASVGGNPKGLVDLSNGTVNESMAIYFSANLDSTTFDMRANNLSQMYQQPSGLKTKNALAYKLNDSNAAFNGAVGTTDTSCIVTNASRLVIGNIYSQTNVFATNGTIRRIGYYNTRLPDSTLQAITS